MLSHGRRWFVAGAWALAGVLMSAGSARADTISATLVGVQDAPSYTTVDVQLNGTTYNNVIAGAIVWDRTGGSAVGQGDHFQSYCIELLQDVYLNSNYTFTLINVADGPRPGVDVDAFGNGIGMGQTKADLLGELWARDYATATQDAVDSAAFQLAVWKVVYEKPVNRVLDLSLGSGALRAVGDTPPGISSTAQRWLDGLTGGNSAPRATLVALSNCEAQDQITLGAPPPQGPTVAPLPSTAVGGLVLLVGVGGAVALRRRLQQAI